MSQSTKQANVYIFVDTNNFIECFETGFKTVSNGPDSLKALLDIMNNNLLILLLPEVVKIEVTRLLLVKENELKEKYTEARQKVNDVVANQEVLDALDKLLKKQQEEFEKTRFLLNNIVNHRNTRHLDLTENIYIAAYKRGLGGKKPYRKPKEGMAKYEHHAQPDCLSLESCIEFLKSTPYSKIYICTKDPDFLDGENIHPDISSEFTNLKYYDLLSELLKSEFNKKLVNPTTAPIKIDSVTDKYIDSQDIYELVHDLEFSNSFDSARTNAVKILQRKQEIDGSILRQVLDAIISNPESYTINQVLSIDNDMNFSKRLYMLFPEYKSVWFRFAKNLLIIFGENFKELEKYNWLFKELRLPTYDNRINLEDLPF